MLGQLQLLQVTHSLTTESVSLLQDLERHDEKAEDQLRERPEVLKQWLAEWELKKEEAMVAMDGIGSVSETDNDVLGEQGNVAMIQSLLVDYTSPPPSVEAFLPQRELMGAADANGTNLRGHIQVLDAIRCRSVWGPGSVQHWGAGGSGAGR